MENIERNGPKTKSFVYTEAGQFIWVSQRVDAIRIVVEPQIALFVVCDREI